jgi:uncharacterized membrane-anchored protein
MAAQRTDVVVSAGTQSKVDVGRPTGLLNKVPEVTIFFWIIKICCTTVGETVADYLNVNLNLGLTGTSIITGVLLVAALAAQFLAKSYRPVRYWLTVAVVSVFGTLVTDNLTDKAHVALEKSAIIFAILLALTFVVWYATEHTLSIHRIFTRRREAFYWTAVLFSFALGTATGDLMAEVLGLGYRTTGLIVLGLIAVTAIAWRLKLNPILSFWIIYILTRPLGASIGDYLSQPKNVGGLALGTTVTSAIFLGGIVAIVAYLTVSKADVTTSKALADSSALDAAEKGGLWQTAAVVVLVLVGSGFGYNARKTALLSSDTAETAAPATAAPASGTATTVAGAATTTKIAASPLGDLTNFRTIAQDTLDKLTAGDQGGATTRITDLEVAWDAGQAKLQARNGAAWTAIDGKIDKVLRALRSTSPVVATEKQTLTDLLTALA